MPICVNPCHLGLLENACFCVLLCALAHTDLLHFNKCARTRMCSLLTFSLRPVQPALMLGGKMAPKAGHERAEGPPKAARGGWRPLKANNVCPPSKLIRIIGFYFSPGEIAISKFCYLPPRAVGSPGAVDHPLLNMQS